MKKVFAFMAIAAMMFVACNKNDNPNNNGGGKEKENENEEEEVTAGVEIDGAFADWATVNAVVAKNNPTSPWEGVAEIRCYADPDFVYYYIKFDAESLEEAKTADTPEMHIRLCINTDDEFESGYQSYFLQGYDFIIEGQLLADGAFVDFDGTLHQRIGSWVALLEPGNNLVIGKGAGNEYEIAMARQIFNNAASGSDVPMPMGDKFQTGIRFYWNGWDEFSNMPNSSIDEVDNGWGNLMEITTTK